MKNNTGSVACSFLLTTPWCAVETIGIILSYKKKKGKVVILFWGSLGMDYQKIKVPRRNILSLVSEEEILQRESFM